jgi:hypothetical protein
MWKRDLNPRLFEGLGGALSMWTSRYRRRKQEPSHKGENKGKSRVKREKKQGEKSIKASNP